MIILSFTALQCAGGAKPGAARSDGHYQKIIRFMEIHHRLVGLESRQKEIIPAAVE
jgi:hypothetical protein